MHSQPLIRISADRPVDIRPDVRRYGGQVVFGNRIGAEVQVDVGPASRFMPARAVTAGVAAFGPERYANVASVDPRAVLTLVGLADGELKRGWEEILARILAEPSMTALLTASAAVPAGTSAEPLVLAAQVIEELAAKGEDNVRAGRLPVQEIVRAVNGELTRIGAKFALQPIDVQRAARMWWEVRDDDPQTMRRLLMYKANAPWAPGSDDHKDQLAIWIAESFARNTPVRLQPIPPAPVVAPALPIPPSPKPTTGCACQFRPHAS